MPIETVVTETYDHPRLPLELQAKFREEGHWAGVTLAQCVEEWATRDPHRIAVVGDRVMTYGDVWTEASRTAGGLQRDGAQPGEYLMAVLDNSWQGLVLEVAASLIGAVFTPRSPHISPALAENLFKQLDVHGLVIASRLLTKPGWREAFSWMRTQLDGRPVWVQGPDERQLTAPLPQLERIGAEGPEPSHVAVHPTAPSLVLATGGTTGTPKSILHCSDSLVYAARQFAKAVEYTSDDVSVAFAPYGHAGGSVFDIYMPLLHGARVLPLSRWKAEDVGPLIERWGGTFFVTMGTHIFDLMQRPVESDRELASVRLVTSGAGPDSLFEDAQKRFDFTLVRVYGCGECPGHAIGRPGDPKSSRLLRDGVPFPGVETRIVGPDGVEVPQGTVGEYECRGPNLFMGYVEQPELTAEAISPEGFYRSGDRMVETDDGYVTWSGRIKEIIRRGGLQIDPVEMEGLLVQFPGIAAVVVVGEPDERLGERAVVVAVFEEGAAEPTLDQLCQFLASEGLPKQSMPERLVITAEIPRTQVGKFHRARVKAELLQTPAGKGVSNG